MRNAGEIESWIKASAAQIKYEKERDEDLNGWALAEGQAESLRNEVRDRLKEALKRAESLEKALYPLMMMKEDIHFPGMSLLIDEARSDASYAVTRLRIALHERIPVQRRGMPYHQQAMWLAASAFSSPNRKATLDMARRIIQEAGLSDDYSPRSEQEWWIAVKKEFYENNK